MKQHCRIDQTEIARQRYSKTCNVRNSIFESEEESMKAFAKACQNLLSVEHWNQVSSRGDIVFTALDRKGEETTHLMTGYLLRISDFHQTGGHVPLERWAVVEGVGYHEGDDEECVKLVLRFIPDPLVCFTSVMPSMATETRSFLVNRFRNRLVVRQVITYKGKEKHYNKPGAKNWKNLLDGIAI